LTPNGRVGGQKGVTAWVRDLKVKRFEGQSIRICVLRAAIKINFILVCVDILIHRQTRMIGIVDRTEKASGGRHRRSRNNSNRNHRENGSDEYYSLWGKFRFHTFRSSFKWAK
jgi:hypothetical protein